MKKILNKLKSWWGNKSDHLTFEDISLSGTLIKELAKWWGIFRKCFWNVVQAVYNIRSFLHTLMAAFKEA